MKSRLLLFFLILPVFYSCSKNEQTEKGPDITQANRVKFDFKSDFDSTNKIIIKTVEINDPEDISRIKEIITYDPFTYIYCISTGSMSFYKDSTFIVTMVFNTLPDLTHIAFNVSGKLIAMSLSEENAKLLESFKNYHEN